MKFKVTNTHCDMEYYKEFNSLEELMQWEDELEYPIIITGKNKYQDENSIEIYDDYRE